MTPDASAAAALAGETASGVSRLAVLAQVQDLDVKLDQIDHRIEHLPERDTRASTNAQLNVLGAEAASLDVQIADLERRQRRHEDEVALVEAKRAQNSQRLYGSHLTSPKEAEALTAEAEALGRRQNEIEDQILELMEELEPLTEARAQLSTRQSDAAEQISRLDEVIAQLEHEADSERSEVRQERETLVASAEPELVAVYERRRAIAQGAPVIGRLAGMVCSACHLEVASVELERIMRLDADELAECPQCGALLVH